MSFSENPNKDNATEPIEVIEIDPQPVSYPDNSSTAHQEITKTANQIQTWYDGLPMIAKLGVTVGVIFLVFSLLTTVLKLVATILSVFILGAIVLLLFRYIISSQS
ncbi:hypothetical protein C7H19_17360 [Aphanothece hegewaldii CCALA 016]|uniref:Uncharacterized protein n=1 Tax=Aphanothece hegewaldii CCALA 016 TaxID=2107694 RepID=A0A2T1LUD5_9CHRO|nr:hypothetical protein [Aphanothece hegewaldii]PSF35151.1 hypothetical protein C7H19_17360 [Aphanothece hegewaldii CCALA 016]